MTRTKVSGGSYAGNEDPRLHFGLRDATGGTVTVTGPDVVTSGPDRFDLEGANGRDLSFVEPNTRAPRPIAWAADAADQDGANGTLRWRFTYLTDFVAYVIERSRTRTFEPEATTRHTLTDRSAAAWAVPGLGAGAHFRIRVIDTAGLESEPWQVISLSAADMVAPVPGADASGLVALAGLVALVRARARGRA